MLSAERLRTLTTPGDWPVTATVGTAANPVTLSGATTTLSENPGRVMEEDCPPEFWATAWLALLTTVSELFVALNTRVKRLFGNRTIIPGKGLLDTTEITPGEIRSSCPSTTFRTGVVEDEFG